MDLEKPIDIEINYAEKTKKQFNIKDIEIDLNRLKTITKKLDYLKSVDCKNKKDKKYTKTLHSLVTKEFKRHFKENTNIPEFTNWFLKYNAEVCFKNYIGNSKFKNKLKSGLTYHYINNELAEIEAREKEAINRITAGTSTNLGLDHETVYNSNKGYLQHFVPDNKILSEVEVIETLRILDGNYYKTNPTSHSFTVIRSTEVLAYFRHNLLKSYLQNLLRDNKKKEKLSLKQIALIHAYKSGHPLTKDEAQTLAKKNGWKSGHKLYQETNLYLSRTKRKGDEGSLIKNQNKKKLIESIIPYLSNKEKSIAEDELAILDNIIKTNQI